MNDRHPTHEMLEAFSNGSLSSHAARAVVAHLVGGCSECREGLALMTGPLFVPIPEEVEISAELDAAYDSAISAAYAAALAKTGGAGRRDPARVVPGAEGLPLPGEAGFATPDVCETLMGRSFALRFTDPGAMLRLAELAAQSAEELDTEVYGAESTADLQARAWAEVANAHRVIGDLPQADRMMTRAVDCRSRGTGDARLLAHLSHLAAALACAQRRFDQAFRLLDIGYSIYIKLGDRHSAGRVLIARGLYAGYTGDPLEGIRYLVHGLDIIDRAQEPKLAFQALHNILLLRIELGEYEEARRSLQQMRPLYTRFNDELDDIKLRWVEGKIAAGLGEFEEAEEAFAESRDRLDRAGLGYRAALVSLDLVSVWLQQGRTGEIRQLVAELLVTFRAVGVEREALAGVLLLRDAVECEQATVELLQLIAHSLGKLDGRSAPPLDPEIR
jgi:tetratricopeptide (TPR) repeat protein